MSETLNLGNGNWATKEDSLLAYNSENGNFKPLPFDFTRASSATVVNKAGLIETVGSGEPRIDFSNDAKGALLLEPTRTNLLPHSEAFENSFWSKFGTSFSVTDNNSVSPSGYLNASKLNVSNTDNLLYSSISFSATNATWTFSIYAKGSGSFDMNIRLSGNAATTQTMTLTSDWQRFDVTSVNGTSITSVESFLDLNNIVNMDIFGAQLEQGSYATSYIPTSGQSGGVTRVADVSSQTPPSGIIGQTEGTVFADVNFVGVNESITNQIFFLREQGSNNGYVFAGFYQGKLNCGLKVGGSTLFDTFFSGVLSKGRYKIAVAYKSGDTKIYINGVQTGFQNNSFGVNNFAQIFLTGSAGTNQLGDINRNFKLYNTRLTDSELIALTK